MHLLCISLTTKQLKVIKDLPCYLTDQINIPEEERSGALFISNIMFVSTFFASIYISDS